MKGFRVWVRWRRVVRRRRKRIVIMREIRWVRLSAAVLRAARVFWAFCGGV